MKRSKKKQVKKINLLRQRELFLIGVALYWAEGRKSNRVSFVNSDPRMIVFLIKWFEVFLGIPKKRLHCRVGINKIHKKRIDKIENYWSRLTGVPRSQFIKPNLRKSRNEKIYGNSNNYYGTLTVDILKSTEILYYLRGLIKTLSGKVSDM